MKSGDTIAVLTYAKVVDVKKTRNGEPHVVVEDLNNGGQLNFAGQDFLDTVFSANDFEEEEDVSKTELAQILQRVGDKPFTVNFDKQDGENRTLVGRLLNANNVFGRSDVIDLTKDPDEHRMRQVDHRTLHWLIFDGTKYSVK